MCRVYDDKKADRLLPIASGCLDTPMYGIPRVSLLSSNTSMDTHLHNSRIEGDFSLSSTQRLLIRSVEIKPDARTVCCATSPTVHVWIPVEMLAGFAAMPKLHNLLPRSTRLSHTLAFRPPICLLLLTLPICFVYLGGGSGSVYPCISQSLASQCGPWCSFDLIFGKSWPLRSPPSLPPSSPFLISTPQLLIRSESDNNCKQTSPESSPAIQITSKLNNTRRHR